MATAYRAPTDDREQHPMDTLENYLNDHLAAATGGLAFAERARDAQEGRDQDAHAVLAEIAQEIGWDREQLKRSIDAVGARANPLKVVAGKVGELAGRLKPNRALLQRSPLSDLVEAESLSIMVLGKRALWVALRDLEDPRLQHVPLAELIRRAEDQHERLEALRRRIGRRVLPAA